MSNTTVEKNLVFPRFEDIPVSTKTFIVMTNMTLDIKKLYEFYQSRNTWLSQNDAVEKRKI